MQGQMDGQADEKIKYQKRLDKYMTQPWPAVPRTEFVFFKCNRCTGGPTDRCIDRQMGKLSFSLVEMQGRIKKFFIYLVIIWVSLLLCNYVTRKP